jgi:hypothetical protein
MSFLVIASTGTLVIGFVLIETSVTVVFGLRSGAFDTLWTRH